MFQRNKGTELDDIGLRIKRRNISTTNTKDWTDYNTHDPGVACSNRSTSRGTVPCVDFYAYLTVDKERNDEMNWEDGNRNLREKPRGMQDIKTIPVAAYKIENCYPIEWGLDLDPDWFAVERLDFKCKVISHVDLEALN